MQFGAVGHISSRHRDNGAHQPVAQRMSPFGADERPAFQNGQIVAPIAQFELASTDEVARKVRRSTKTVRRWVRDYEIALARRHENEPLQISLPAAMMIAAREIKVFEMWRRGERTDLECARFYSFAGLDLDELFHAYELTGHFGEFTENGCPAKLTSMISRSGATMQTIDAAIAEALGGKATADTIAAVLADAEQEEQRLAEQHTTIKATALDPATAGDALEAACTDLRKVEFSKERISTGVQRLRERLSEQRKAEVAAEKESRIAAARKRQEVAADRLREEYPQHANAIAEILQECAAADRAMQLARGDVTLPAETSATLAGWPLRSNPGTSTRLLSATDGEPHWPRKNP